MDVGHARPDGGRTRWCVLRTPRPRGITKEGEMEMDTVWRVGHIQPEGGRARRCVLRIPRPRGMFRELILAYHWEPPWGRPWEHGAPGLIRES